MLYEFYMALGPNLMLKRSDYGELLIFVKSLSYICFTYALGHWQVPQDFIDALCHRYLFEAAFILHVLC
jgi:hypothetical protein